METPPESGQAHDSWENEEFKTLARSGSIPVPEGFAALLKEYAKEVLKEQPIDLIAWSAEYFRNLLEERQQEEYDKYTSMSYVPEPEGDKPIDLDGLKTLHRELGSNMDIAVDKLTVFWQRLGLDEKQLISFLNLGKFYDSVQWDHFTALAAASLAEDIWQTMALLCVIWEGLPYSHFEPLCQYISGIDEECTDDELYTNLSVLRQMCADGQLITAKLMKEAGLADIADIGRAASQGPSHMESHL